MSGCRGCSGRLFHSVGPAVTKQWRVGRYLLIYVQYCHITASSQASHQLCIHCLIWQILCICVCVHAWRFVQFQFHSWSLFLSISDYLYCTMTWNTPRRHAVKMHVSKFITARCITAFSTVWPLTSKPSQEMSTHMVNICAKFHQISPSFITTFPRSKQIDVNGWTDGWMDGEPENVLPQSWILWWWRQNVWSLDFFVAGPLMWNWQLTDCAVDRHTMKTFLFTNERGALQVSR